MNDDDLFRAGMVPERAGRPVRLVRRVLWRLLRPWFAALTREQRRLAAADVQAPAALEPPAPVTEHADALRASVEALALRVDALEHELARAAERHDDLDRRARAAAALAWDHAAVVNRLAALEDRLAREEPER